MLAARQVFIRPENSRVLVGERSCHAGKIDSLKQGSLDHPGFQNCSKTERSSPLEEETAHSFQKTICLEIVFPYSWILKTFLSVSLFK